MVRDPTRLNPTKKTTSPFSVSYFIIKMPNDKRTCYACKHKMHKDTTCAECPETVCNTTLMLEVIQSDDFKNNAEDIYQRFQPVFTPEFWIRKSPSPTTRRNDIYVSTMSFTDDKDKLQVLKGIHEAGRVYGERQVRMRRARDIRLKAMVKKRSTE